MKQRLLLPLLFLTFATPAADISMMGLKIGSPKQALNKITLTVKGREENMIKYTTANGNDFSVTTEQGKVVYMENDWLQSPAASQPLFSGFEFGKTSLRAIRKTMGTNGFTYTERNKLTTETEVIQFNCFEFDSPNNEVLVTITKAALQDHLTEDNIADHLKLDAVIISNKAYLDKTWGTEKIYDTNYKKIKL
jgi:hypothetical protein